MIIFAFIAAGVAMLVFLAFVAVVLGIRATERRHALRQPGYGRIDAFARRLLGVYADPPRCKDESARNTTARGGDQPCTLASTLTTAIANAALSPRTGRSYA